MAQPCIKPCSYQPWSDKFWKFTDWPKLFFGNATVYNSIDQWQQTQYGIRLTTGCLYLFFQPIMYNTEWLLELHVRFSLQQRDIPQLYATATMLNVCNLIIIWESTYTSVCYLLWNGAMYGGKFCMRMHAACAGHGLGLILIGIIVMIYFRQINTISPYGR